MDRKDVYREIEATLGLVPSFFKKISDATLSQEWELFKAAQLAPGAVPPKYRELIGLGIAAVTKCSYCTFYHTELARTFGATEAELEDAIHYAKATAGWSTYVNGHQMDQTQFRKEVLQVCEHVKRNM